MPHDPRPSSRWVNFPFAPGRLPFYYGWVMMFGSILAVLASIPGQTMGVGVYTDYLMAAWGLSRTQVSAAYMVGTLVSGTVLPIAGKALDRFGVRIMGVVCATGLGVSLLLLAGSDLAVGVRPAPLLLAMPLLMLAFFAVRFFGQGCLAMMSRVIIGKWWQKRRGLVTGISGLFVAIGFNYSPQLLNDLIRVTDWRTSLYLLAGVIGLGVSFVFLIIYRDTPEACGLHIDGITPDPDAVEDMHAANRIHKEFTRAEAVRTLAFWVFSLALSAHGMLMTALTFHIADIAGEAGITRDVAFSVFLPMAFFAVPTNFIGSWISDHIKLKYLVCFFSLTEMMGAVGLSFMHTDWGWWTLIAGLGMTGGLFGTLATVACPRFFGRLHLGAISGLNMSIMVWTSALGPVLFSVVHDWTGGYRQAILAYCLWPALIFLFATRAENPQDKIARQISA